MLKVVSTSGNLSIFSAVTCRCLSTVKGLRLVTVHGPVLLDALQLPLLLSFKVSWRKHAVSDVLALWVIKHLDVIERVGVFIFSDFECPAPNAGAFKQVEEALGNSIVTAIPASPYAMFQIVVLGKRRPAR